MVWCKACEHQVEPDPGEMAARYGAENASARLARAAGLCSVRWAGRRFRCDRSAALGPVKRVLKA
jgi:hypothetical protein